MTNTTQNTGQQPSPGNRKKKQAAKKDVIHITLADAEKMNNTLKLKFRVILDGKDGKPLCITPFRIFYKEETFEGRSDENGTCLLEKEVEYVEGMNSIEVTAVILGTNAKTFKKFPIPKPAPKPAMPDSMQIDLVDSELRDDKYFLKFQVNLGGKSPEAKCKKDIKIFYKGKSLFRGKSDENGDKIFDREIDYVKDMDKIKVTGIVIGTNVKRTESFPLPTPKKEEQPNSIDIELVKSSHQDGRYHLRFQVTMIGKNLEAISNKSFEIFCKGENFHQGESNEKGLCVFNKEVDFIEGEENIELTGVIIETGAKRTKKFSLPMPKLKKFTPPKIISAVPGSPKFSWEKEMEIPIIVKLDGKNYKPEDFEVRFEDSSHKLLDFKEANVEGLIQCILTIPFDDVLNIARYKNGKKKIIVELAAKSGEGEKAKVEKSQKEIELDISLPAGSPQMGLITFFIRRWKHSIDFAKVTAYLIAMHLFVMFAGYGFMNFMIAIVGLTSIVFWWNKHKSIFRTILATFIFCIGLLACLVDPSTFSKPMLDGFAMAYVIGIPVYFVEEIFRKPDGNAYKNLYPWWAIIGAMIAMAYFSANVLASVIFIFKGSPDPLALNSVLSTNFADNLPLINHLPYNFKNAINHASDDIFWIVRLTFMCIALLFVGGTGEVFDWIKAKKIKLEAASVGGAGGGLYLLASIWDTIKDFVPRFFRRTKK